MTHLYVTSGDDYASSSALTVNATDAAGAALDLTGWTLTFAVSRRGVAAFTAKTVGSGITVPTQTGGDVGVAYITLDAADTASLAGNYEWELQGVSGGKIRTLDSGRLHVAPDLITA